MIFASTLGHRLDLICDPEIYTSARSLATMSNLVSLNHHKPTFLFLHCILLSGCLVASQNTEFTFKTFSNHTSMTTLKDVHYNGTDFSYSLNWNDTAYDGGGSCGKLFYRDPVRLKASPTARAASFSTSFTFQILCDNGNQLTGDGFAFAFATDRLNISNDSGGGRLCLLSAAENNNTSSHVFAVEFDTFQNGFYNDSSFNHIGVDVNSMTSIATHDLACANHDIHCNYLCYVTDFTTWIDYDSELQTLHVRFANATNIKLAKTAIYLTNLDLSTVFHEYMYVGFSGSTGISKEIHKIKSWSFKSNGSAYSSPSPSRHARTRASLTVILSICGGCTATFMLLGVLILFWFRHQKILRMEEISEGGDPATKMHFELGPQLYSYRELRKATKNFSETELLGSGGFGAVYKGTLKSSGALIAVKRCKKPNSKHGEKSFVAEATSINQIRHRNLVQLQGWCHEKGQLLLVYDYMPNKSVADWLFSGNTIHRGLTDQASYKSLNVLTLDLRYNILAGVSAAVEYLHEDWQQCVLHRDIKASNVMLDADFNPHLGDFGSPRLMDHQKVEKTTIIAGTLGYMAPEMPYTGKATKETDVYSFGVLVLEVVCGRRAIDTGQTDSEDLMLVDSVWHAHEAGNLLSVIDASLLQTIASNCSTISWMKSANSADTKSSQHDYISGDIHLSVMPPDECDAMRDLLKLGLLCSLPDPSERPSMRVVNGAFQSGDMAILPPLPATKPIVTAFEADIVSQTVQHLTTPPSTDDISTITAIHRQLTP